jgi:hypothetical protein
MLKIPVRPSFRRFTWKWLMLFVLLFAGLGWIMLTSVSAEPHLYSTFITAVRYVLPFVLLIVMAIWILRQFPYNPIRVKD